MKVPLTLFLFFSLISYHLSAQHDSTRIITGFVYSNHDKEGLPGCNVYIQNSLHGTITDIEGKFELEVPRHKEVTLIVSCISEPVLVRIKKNKSHYRIKLDKQKPSIRLKLSSGIITSSNNNNWQPQLALGLEFLFSPVYRLKYLSGTNLNYYRLAHANNYIIAIETPLQIQYSLLYKFYLKGGFTLGLPVSIETDNAKTHHDMYLNPAIGFGYQTNSKWGFELNYHHGITDIGFSNNKINSLTASLNYRLR